jgi:hypothetical protein
LYPFSASLAVNGIEVINTGRNVSSLFVLSRTGYVTPFGFPMINERTAVTTCYGYRFDKPVDISPAFDIVPVIIRLLK